MTKRRLRKPSFNGRTTPALGPTRPQPRPVPGSRPAGSDQPLPTRRHPRTKRASLDGIPSPICATADPKWSINNLAYTTVVGHLYASRQPRCRRPAMRLALEHISGGRIDLHRR